MTYHRVKMIVEFVVPVGREHYGSSTTEAHWQKYAEHDMLHYIKDIEDVPEGYRETAECGNISFEWGEQFEEEK